MFTDTAAHLGKTAAAFKRLPLGNAVELTYNGCQEVLASFTAVSGIAFVSTILIGSLTVPPDADTRGWRHRVRPPTTSAGGHQETPR